MNKLPLQDRFPGNDVADAQIHASDGQYFPHWELKDAIYHVSFRLDDSLPQYKLQELLRERQRIKENILNDKSNLSAYDIMKIDHFYSAQVEYFIDSGYGSSIFRDSGNAEIMRDVLMTKRNDEYDLYAWCIMPNHIHVLFSLLSEHHLSKVVAEWKSCAAHMLNKRMNRKGRLWNVDYFNRIIRTYDDYCSTKEYIWKNPEKAGLYDWPWRWKIQDG